MLAGTVTPFIVGPCQSEAGILTARDGFLKAAREFCHTLRLAPWPRRSADRLYRTGAFLASITKRTSTHMVTLTKAISGGLVPILAPLMTDRIYETVFMWLKRSVAYTSTFSGKRHARAGWIWGTRNVVKNENIASFRCDLPRQRLTAALSGYEMVKGVGGLGMLNSIQFEAPKSIQLRRGLQTFKTTHTGMFGLRDHDASVPDSDSQHRCAEITS